MTHEKRPRKQKATMRTAIEQLGRQDTIEHYNAVMLEEILSTVRTLGEGMAQTEKRLEGKIESFRSETNQHFALIESVLRVHAQEFKVLKVQRTS